MPGSRGAGDGVVWPGLAGGAQVAGGLGGVILGVILKGLWFCFIMCCISFGQFILLISFFRLWIKLASVS